MVDWNFLASEFDRLGINDYQCWGNVIPLDKVFGLDEKKHNDGLNTYGVSHMSLFSRGVSIEYYKGTILRSYDVCSQGRFKECGNKNKRLLTESEEQGVYEFCMTLINNRKEQLEKGKYWIEHFNDFLADCLSVAKEYIKEHGNKYNIDLRVGNSIADRRVAPALLITYKDGSQRGYIKLFQNRFGDIRLDAYCMCHTEWGITDPSNIKDDIVNACAFCM